MSCVGLDRCLSLFHFSLVSDHMLDTSCILEIFPVWSADRSRLLLSFFVLIRCFPFASLPCHIIVCFATKNKWRFFYIENQFDLALLSEPDSAISSRRPTLDVVHPARQTLPHARKENEQSFVVALSPSFHRREGNNVGGEPAGLLSKV